MMADLTWPELPNLCIVPAYAVEDVLIGGNHLASALISLNVDPAQLRESTYQAVAKEHGPLAADMWAAWKAIMDLRFFTEALRDSK